MAKLTTLANEAMLPTPISQVVPHTGPIRMSKYASNAGCMRKTAQLTSVYGCLEDAACDYA